ncbi:MAG: acyl-ACP--UDP-N-acetylglucosamine O-acyltransferase [Gammaproteobacteria bacterium]|nr:acyl-ACP--UDP-N-acetylglucosamine O-acyltransferase [Gammaproteobacteria bacterium]
MIDPRAAVDPSADLEDGVEVGPFSIIGPEVKIGRRTRIGPHVVIKGPAVIGRDNRIYQFTSIGDDPQDKKYAGEPTRLEIGDRNVIREFATINRGTVQDSFTTRIGNDNLLMAYTHVAHDCQIGNHVIMANAASLGGHVHIHDHAILGGFTIVHQFCRIGGHAFCAMGTGVTRDVPPYIMVSGHPAKPYGINSEGLRRRGFGDLAIQRIKRAYKTLYMQQLKLETAIEALKEQALETPEVALYVEFLQTSSRSIVR